MVNYRSTALAETAPQLVSSVDSNDVSRIPAIVAANQAAERVREEFKKKGRTQRSSGKNKDGSGPLDEEADKAGRYDRRLKMNRQSAAASRVRREAYIKALEQQLLLEHEKFSTLRADFNAEKNAHSKLRTDVETARLLAAAPVTTSTQSSVAEQPLPEMTDEDLLSELPLYPPCNADAFSALLLGGVDQLVGQPPLPISEAYAANVTDVFNDLDLPLPEIPPQIAVDVDPQNISQSIDSIMNLETE